MTYLDLGLDGRAAPPCLPDIPSDVNNKRMFALIPTIIILVLSISTYALRIYCRKKTGQRIGWDDILMGIGLLISIEPSICEFLLLANGLGKHICNVTPQQAWNFGVITFALQRANQPALACVKLSIVFFYLRIFEVRPFRIAAHCVNAYTVAWAISTWIVNLTSCTPIAFYYDHTIKGGSCRNQAVSGSINGGLSLFGDILVLALPLPMIWQLKINLRKKFAICGIFLLGCFVCVASIIRIVEIAKFTPTDATYTQVYTSTWTTLEQGVAVISGNLPLLAPLFDGWLRNRGTYGYGSYGRRAKYASNGRAPGSGIKSNHRFGGGGDSTGRGAGGTGKFSTASKSGSLGSDDFGSPTATDYRGTPRLEFGSDGLGTTSISSAKRGTVAVGERPLGHREFDRLSDTESQTPFGGLHDQDFEMDDRAILVKTKITVTNSKGPF